MDLTNIDVSNIITLIFGLLLSMIGYLLKRSVDTLSQTVTEHNSKLNDHDVKIALNQHTTDEVYKLIDVRLQSIDNNFHNIAEELKRMNNKMENYDKNINEFYRKYKLEEK